VKEKSSKKVDDYLQSGNHDLRSLFAKVRVLEDINRKVSAYLDKNIVDYCQVANLLGNRLVILAANGSIATQLRFQITDLLRKFKQDAQLKHIHHIDAKVHPGFTRGPTQQSAPPKGKKMPPLSAATAATIRDFAESLDDPKLKEVMKRIAQHTDKS